VIFLLFSARGTEVRRALDYRVRNGVRCVGIHVDVSRQTREEPDRVLIVGSAADSRRFVGQALERDGFVVAEADDGGDDRRVAQEFRPDCIVFVGAGADRPNFLDALRKDGAQPCAVVALDEAPGASPGPEIDGVIRLSREGLGQDNLAVVVRAAIDLFRARKHGDGLAERLTESETRLCAFIEHAPVAVAMFDNEMRHLAFSKQWLELFGFRKDVSGQSLYDVLPAAPERWRRLHQLTLAGNCVSRREDLFFQPDSRRQWLAWDATPWRTSEGKIGGLVLAVRDITGRRAIEDALEMNQARLEAALASMSEALAIYSGDGRLAQFNGSFVSFHRFKDEAACQSAFMSDPAFLEYWSEAGPAPPQEWPDRRAINGERGIGVIFSLRRKDTGDQWIGSYNFGPIRGSNGEIVGAVVTARDVTEKIRAEEARREAEQRKDEFLAILAHELRNPLAPIHNAVQVLRGAPDAASPGQRRALFDMMDRQVQHLVRLVDDLIEISRIERGKIDLRRELCDLAAILRNAVETSQPLLEKSQHRFNLRLPAGIAGEIAVMGDHVRLVQVFANLINNAAKYTPPGGMIDVRAERQGDTAVVAVCDTGIGIAPETLPHVFDLFVQAHSKGPGRSGLGVGLALTRKLVELHGGSIEAKSKGQGQGSELVVRLPVADSAAEKAPSRPRRGAAAAHPTHALVIDDDHDVADSLAILLSTLGAKTRVVYDGASGIAAIREFTPEVVFVDLGMPGMDGYETARRIRAGDTGRKLKLVALTGWGQEEARARTKEAGFDAHLIKPASIEALEQTLHEVARA
jgi:PAS domain S-box-containing protein